MRLNILIGGKAGQGINKVSAIIAQTLLSQGYFIFNYRDYPSIIRGGHNFNVLSISDKPIASHESKIDIIIALDENTKQVHKNELTKKGIIIDYKPFLNLGLNANIALAGALAKVLGIEKQILLNQINSNLKGKPYLKSSLEAATVGYDSQKQTNVLEKLNNKPTLLSGSKAIALGAINSNIDLYIAYPMTPATNALHELAKNQLEHNFMAFQAESEISVVNMALGSSFTGAKTMIGTSGGGYDLMTEGLSMQGISEIPLVVYLASRVGPGTGIPTYNMQGDLDIALRAGHGEFPRIVIAPGDPIETIEITNQAFYLSEKHKALTIILSDKHIAESEFSSTIKPQKPLKIKVNREVPGERNIIIKATSYEHNQYGITTENAQIAIKNANKRLEKYKKIQQACTQFPMIKTHGKKNSKNLIIAWGSPKGAIVDAIKDLDYKFLQVIYMKPLSNQIKKEMQKANKIILIESNLTGQLGRIIREKTGISIKNRILKYDGRPFRSDELKKQLEEELRK
jgi:2-oxoglutarate ferredoxin oxidoreductase subunit alpha|tara:strand:+ start:2206 stop:3747 length:1542 start_codon:yes stop_codon:yes gene_type:complete